MLALLLAVLAAAPSPKPGSIAADGRVVLAEGIRFRLPPRFTYRVETVNGDPAYVAVAPDESSVVVVAAARSDSTLPCTADQEGVEVRAYRTKAGLDGCVVAGAAAEGGGMAVVWLTSDGVLVGVTAVASDRSASGLATSVADSVQVDVRAASAVTLPILNVPRAEPRLVGCFEQSSGTSLHHAFGRAGRVRCLRDDLTFTERGFAYISGEIRDIYHDVQATYGSASESDELRGTWLYEDGVLALTYEDGSQAEWSITFSDTSDNVLADDTLWERR